ncbi:MAG: primosomal protein N', partial [Bifidobacteriaceae bacterium]|nr:primosomal protein N' [Bifidobacteriaceae bacterium]
CQWCGTSASNWKCKHCGRSVAIFPYAAVTTQHTSNVQWLNREALLAKHDFTAGTRIPSTAVNLMLKALEKGPVLLSIPHDGLSESLCCVSCFKQARCMKCDGVLQKNTRSSVIQCQWCGTSASNWKCKHCGSERMKSLRVGASGTVQELRGLFRNIPIIVSTPTAPQGVITSIEKQSAIVVATVGSEPHIRTQDGTTGEYACVAILDAWTSLYGIGVDSRNDILNAWMHVVSMCAPVSRAGVSLLIGETDTDMAHALLHWDGSYLAAKELEERRQLGLPPACAAARIWGEAKAVEELLAYIGARQNGKYALLSTSQGDLPSVLGPVFVSTHATPGMLDMQVEQTVKAIVRVSVEQRDNLAKLLRNGVAKHMASRNAGELRFQLDPKDF